MTSSGGRSIRPWPLPAHLRLWSARQAGVERPHAGYRYGCGEHGALYVHFPSKEDALFAIMRMGTRAHLTRSPGCAAAMH